MKKLPTQHALRYFARTVFADRLAGDEFLRTSLSELRRRQADVATGAGAFEHLMRQWRSLRSDAPARNFTDLSLLQSFGPPPSVGRLALILVDALGISMDEAARILEPSDEPIEDLLTAERRALLRRFDATVVIIVDEFPLGVDFEGLLSEIGVSVAGLARDVETGVKMALETRPSIVLASHDPDGTEAGVDWVAEIQSAHDCPVVFVTERPTPLTEESSLEQDFVVVDPHAPDAVRVAIAHCLDVRERESRNAGVTRAEGPSA